MSVLEKRYEGKAKIIYATSDPSILLAHFKDDATAFNGAKHGTIVGKGQMNCRISQALFQRLEATGIPTHYLDSPDPGTMHVKALSIVPLEVIVRNLAAGSLCRQTGLPLGQRLTPPIVEFCYKNDTLGDPLLTRDRIYALNLASESDLDRLRDLALQVNTVLIDFFQQCQMTLVDFKLEFGRDPDRKLYVADEISPDSCRLWDNATDDPNARVLDKDRFRHDLGNVEVAYQRVLDAVLAVSEQSKCRKSQQVR